MRRRDVLASAVAANLPKLCRFVAQLAPAERGYVGLTVAIEPTKALRTQLNTALFGINGRLNDRGSDAHVIVIAPREYGKLNNCADATGAKLAATLTE